MRTLISIKPGRINILKNGKTGSGPVFYWMSRDQRARQNWALLEAARLAQMLGRSLVCVFTLKTNYPGAFYRHFAFMLKGLAEVEQELFEHGIPLLVLQGNPPDVLSKTLCEYDAAALVCDFDPLRIKQQWKEELLPQIPFTVEEVDAHNIVPCRIVSSKQETGAYTLRPKLRKLWNEYLDVFPDLSVFKNNLQNIERPNFGEILSSNNFDRSVGEVSSFIPGITEAEKLLACFTKNGLKSYNDKHGDPNADAVSNLSPYLHFGQISAQQIVLDILASCEPSDSRAAFLEQLVVRRELTDNFCLYNPDYDHYNGFPEWAKRSLDKHLDDKRSYLYSSDDFEQARTHDELWNAAQREMVSTGKMHNYMRMYWAKKILEWTASPREAMQIAVYLNDKYELDGRDPNGYAGCAWAIGGVHDRPWFEREIFGQIRYMNYNGCKSKFDVVKYCNRFKG
jgi:deoxyribodipyrimidine photo-lyase